MTKKNFQLLIISSIILFIVCSSFYFGFIYSVFNTDFHHYSIILEPFLDAQNGLELNKDIFIQYGNGQVYLFKILSNFFEINFYTAGLVTQFIFSLKFIIFFFILRFFVDNLFSTIGVIIYYLLYTFTQTISGDIYASFFLHLFVWVYLFNFKKKNFYLIILSSLLIFLTVSFRHTYLLNWVAFIPILIFLNFFINKELKYENKIAINFLIILGIYLLYLFIDGRFFLWFDQFLGFGLNTYLDIGTDYEMNIFERIKKLIFYFLRIIRHSIWPNSYGSNYFFSVIFAANLIFIFNLSFKFFIQGVNKIKGQNKLLFVLSLLSFCGSIQVIKAFEIARFLNASFPLLIIFIYLLYQIFNTLKNQYHKYFFIIFIFIFSIPLTLINIGSDYSLDELKLIKRYPFQSNNFQFGLNNHSVSLEGLIKIKNKYSFSSGYFAEPKNKIFKGKRLTQEYLDFYEDIEKDLCTYSAIYNFTVDRALHFLCSNQKIYISSLFFLSLAGSESKTLEYVLSNKELEYILNNKQEAVIVTHEKIALLKIYKIYNVPKFYRYNNSDTVMRVFPDKIYTYKIN